MLFALQACNTNFPDYTPQQVGNPIIYCFTNKRYSEFVWKLFTEFKVTTVTVTKSAYSRLATSSTGHTNVTKGTMRHTTKDQSKEHTREGRAASSVEQKQGTASSVEQKQRLESGPAITDHHEEIVGRPSVQDLERGKTSLAPVDKLTLTIDLPNDTTPNLQPNDTPPTPPSTSPPPLNEFELLTRW